MTRDVTGTQFAEAVQLWFFRYDIVLLPERWQKFVKKLWKIFWLTYNAPVFRNKHLFQVKKMIKMHANI